jgi:hypothetical protein
MASTYLELIPKESRYDMKALLMPTHLFNIALRLRMGVDQQPDKSNEGRCRCKEHPRGKKGENSVMDKKGFHLTACKWGGWCTHRHDATATEICNWMKAAGYEATTHQRQCKDSLPRWRGKYRIPDILMKDQSGSHTAFDIKVTRTDQQANKHLFAATAGEKKKMCMNDITEGV